MGVRPSGLIGIGGRNFYRRGHEMSRSAMTIRRPAFEHSTVKHIVVSQNCVDRGGAT
jgi:hypothetical protein